MTPPGTSRLHVNIAMLLWAAFSIPLSLAPGGGNVARIVVWQPKPSMSRDLEEGYKRHLEWHRRNGDQWNWYGWSIVSGEHDGYFVDGTFFHSWKELDSPVNPAADGADAEVNVVSYGEVRSAATYESVPALTDLGAQRLMSPLLTFCYLSVQPGRGTEFESLVEQGLRGSSDSTVKQAMLRPINGASDYLLVLTGEKTSDLAAHAEFISRLLRAVAENVKGGALVSRYRTETGRYRPDLSSAPADKPK